MSSDIAIANLPASNVMTGVEVFPLDQPAGTTVQATLPQLAAGVLSFLWPISASEQSAGVAARVTARQFYYGDVRRYGAIGLGEINTQHINDALAMGAATGLAVSFAGLNLVSTGGHVHDISLHSVFGYGAKINLTSMSGAIGWTTTCSIDGSGTRTRQAFEGVSFTGNGSGTGWYLYGPNAGNGAACCFAPRNVFVNNFSTNMLLGSNVYIIHCHNVILNGGTTCLSVPSNITNSGENINFYGGGMSNSQIAISAQNGGCDIHLFGTSLDANVVDMYLSNGSTVDYVAPHKEFNNASALTASPFQIEGANCRLSIVGGSISADGNGPFNWPSVFDIGAGASVYLDVGTQLNNLGNVANTLATGLGKLIIGAPSFMDANNNNPSIVGASANVLADGGFEQLSFVDNVCITADTATITSRLSGQNLNLSISTAAHHTGAQCLAAAKTYGGGSNCVFSIFVPCRALQRFGATGWYSASAAQTSNIYVTGGFQNVLFGANGLPFLLNASQTFATTIASVSSTWAQFTTTVNANPLCVAPNWANYFVLSFNLNSFVGAASFFLDDLIITPM